MFCNNCGAEITDGVKFCTSCGAPVAQAESPAPVQSASPAPSPVQNTVPQQPFNADLAKAAADLFSYCKVDLNPKYSKGGAAAFIVIAILLILFGAVGEALFMSVIGLIVGGIGMLAVWGAYKGNLKTAARLRSIMTNDGEETVLRAFASAEPMANDQFRMSAAYVFAKKKAVFRVIDITNVTRVTESTNFIPTGVRLDVIVQDESGQINLTLCRLHLGKSKNEAEDIYQQILARQQFVKQQYLAAQQAARQQAVQQAPQQTIEG